MPTTPHLPPLAVACPACGSPAGQPCTSHGGTRVRRDNVHLPRKVAYDEARIDANPAARLIHEAARERRGMHGKHAAELLDEHGYTTEAEHVRRAVSRCHGHMSAKQAAQFLIDIDGEGT
jgi:hypothetical protein